MKTSALCLVVFCLALSTAAAQWSTKVRISPGSLSASLNENMASCFAASNDTLHVVWSDKRSRGSAVYYTRSIDSGLTWRAPIAITDTLGSASFPAIAVSGRIVHVVWMDTTLHHRASFYKRSLDGGVTWSSTFVLDSNTDFWPGLAASGSLVVVSINKLAAPSNTEVYFRRSTNNGATWDPEQQISNAVNRSEDPAIAAVGSNVDLSWNDKRSGTMNIYFRHSSDAGVTWGAETQLTTPNSYTSMVSINGNNVDVPFGIAYNSTFDIGIRQSTDGGLTFAPVNRLTNTAVTNVYPVLVRDGQNLHLVYDQFGTGGGVTYIHSTDGGANWTAPSLLSTGSQGFLALTGCTVHLMWLDSGRVYYMRKVGGNGECATLTSMLSYLSDASRPAVDSAFQDSTVCRVDTIVNTGNTDLTITSVTVVRHREASYTIAPSGVSLPITLHPNGRLPIDICATIRVQDSSARTLVVHFTSPGGNDSISKVLFVFGERLCSQSTPVSLFDGVTLSLDGNAADTEVANITNCGNVWAQYTAAISGPDSANYILYPYASSVVAPQGTAQFTVIYRPRSAGRSVATLVGHGTGVRDVKVQLRGQSGCAVLSAKSPSISDTKVGDSSNFSVVIDNTKGNIDWYAGFPSIDPQGIYKINIPDTVRAGQILTVTGSFFPKAAGVSTAILTFPGGGPCGNQFEVSLSGRGLSSGVRNDGSSTLQMNISNVTSGQFVTVDLPNEGSVRLEILDILGRPAQTVDGRYSAGQHTLKLNAELPDGTYIVTIESNGNRVSKRINIAR